MKYLAVEFVCTGKPGALSPVSRLHTARGLGQQPAPRDLHGQGQGLSRLHVARHLPLSPAVHLCACAAGQQGRFNLVDVRQAGVSIYDAGQERLHPLACEELLLPTLLDAQGVSAVRLDLLTPLRFKRENHLAATLDFTAFVRLVLRRVHNLCALEGREFRLPPEDFQRLRQRAADMRVVTSDLHWKDWRRYSGRQSTSMQLGGLMGSLKRSDAKKDCYTP